MILKMNAVVDPVIVKALYRASQAGVEIDLIVRGQCVLVPGIRGMSSRIRVRSIVGRFLEHSRIFYFENGGNPELYLGSADWMPRNLYDRVEVLFPVKDPHLCERLCTEILSAYLADARKTRILGSDGKYSRPGSGRNPHGFSVQEYVMRVASANGDSLRRLRLAKPSVIYTAPDVKLGPEITPSDEADTQETTNAAV